MASKKTPARKKAAAKKAAKKTSPAKKNTVKRTPAKKPGKKAKTKRSPAKKASNDEASEARVASLHQEVEENGALVDDPADAPWEAVEPADGVSEPPDEEEAEAVVSGVEATPLSAVLRRCLRFVEKRNPLVQLFPNWVIGAGAQGIVMHPWSVTDIFAEGHVVDGFQLERMLKNAGRNASIRARSDGGIEVKGTGKKFSMPVIPETVPQLNFPPPEAYKPFHPGLFIEAAKFAGKDNIEPPQFAGVQIDSKGVTSSDRASFFAGATGVAGLNVCVPRNAFDDVDGEVMVAPDANENLFIYVPSTGEYRMVVSYSESLPNVRAVAENFNPAFWVDVPRKDFMSAVNSCAIVQKGTGPVRLYVWQTDEGAFLEVQAGGSTEGQFTSRMPVQIHGDPMLPAGAAAGGMAKVCVGGVLLLRLAKLYPHPERIILGFGGQPDIDIGLQPVVAATEAFKAVVQPMRPIG